MKKKSRLVFLVIACISLVALTAAVLLIVSEINKPVDEDRIKDVETGERITVAETCRLLSYLHYDKTGRAELEDMLTPEQRETYGWCADYMNALVNAGVIEDTGRFENPEDSLECTQLRDLLVNTAKVLELDYKKVIEGLPDRALYTSEGDRIYLEDFIKLYNHMLEMVGENGRTELVEDTIFVLGVIEASKSNGRFQAVTNEGKKFDGIKFQDYCDLFEDEVLPPEFEVENTGMRGYPKLYDYLDCNLVVLRCGSEIVYISDISSEQVVLHNVWLVRASGTKVNTFVDGMEREFEVKAKLSDSVYTEICDITIQDRKVTGIKVKKDTIKGKVLMTGDTEIEIDGLGKVEFDEHFRIYKVYDELEMERTSSILVGYDNTEFIIEDGKICAALIKEKLKAKNIRVLVSVGNNSVYYHDTVEVSVDRDFTVENLGGSKEYKSGTVIKLDKDSELLKYGRVKIIPSSENGKTKILSIKRAYGVPAYRGTIEVAVTEKGLVVVNELSIEEYLYTVVPSEMPNSYGVEALKVQAICARSFAYSQLTSNRYSSYGAHVDDTTNSQVYNNVKETENSIYAVKDTYGKTIEYNGKIVRAYYFSTSCGYTADARDVWDNYSDVEYYSGNLQANATQRKLLGGVDMSVEENFRNFILTGKVNGSEVETFDDSFSWYRWNVTINKTVLSERINSKLKEWYESKPAYVKTLVEGKGSVTTPSGIILEGVFKSVPITSIGELQHIEVLVRGDSGIAKELLLVGSEATVKIMYQSYMRKVLAPKEEPVYLNNGSKKNSMSSLPSGYFIIDLENDNFVIRGGGYGHGVGMSQNGVKGMVNAGYKYEDILKHFYTGIDIGFIYE